KTTLAAFIAVCPQIDTLKIKGRGEKSLNDFIAWVKQTYPQVTTIKVVDTLEDVVRDADLVTYCSSGEVGDPSNYPIVKREWVKPGAFMAMPASCSLDEGMESSEVRKVLDNTGLYEAWFEELPKPAHHCVPVIGVRFMDMIAEGKMQRDELEDIGKIVAGDAQGRRNDEEIIIMSVGGMPVEDVAWGTVVYRNAIAKGIGVKLNLWETPALR
ncbi:ornithine cyclodeaminase, partial [Pseudomonas sp. KHB2.9]